MATATAPETAAKDMPGAETRDSPGNRILLSSGIKKNATANRVAGHADHPSTAWMPPANRFHSVRSAASAASPLVVSA